MASMNTLRQVRAKLKKLANKKQAVILQRFFKTGKGEYGEGDVFLGIKVPVQRSVAKEFGELKIDDAFRLLKSRAHEHRLTALFIIIQHYKKSDSATKTKIFNQYIKNSLQVNNWDLVDLSAPNIVGEYLVNKPRTILYKLAKSSNLWERRIAMLATFTFIRQKDFTDTLAIAKLLLDDKHDLMHKAVGWMLREVGKRDQAIEKKFLRQCYKRMPRTMLRYAIEKFDERTRKAYLAGTI